MRCLRCFSLGSTWRLRMSSTVVPKTIIREKAEALGYPSIVVAGDIVDTHDKYGRMLSGNNSATDLAGAVSQLEEHEERTARRAERDRQHAERLAKREGPDPRQHVFEEILADGAEA